MINQKKQLREDIQETYVLGDMMSAYEELAALRMKRIREQVLKSREYHNILRSYFHEISNDHTPLENTPVLPKKRLAILISDDKGLYGDILTKTRSAFISFVKEHNDFDIAVIGMTGIESLKKELSFKKLTTFSFADDRSQISQLEAILTFLADYTEATVFHGKFISLINQTAEKTNLTGGDEDIVTTKTDHREYLFEPSREKLLSFFQQEILAILFEELVLEASLAKQASRMISLERANDEIKNRLQKLHKINRTLHAQQENKKQITYLAGLTLWRIH